MYVCFPVNEKLYECVLNRFRELGYDVSDGLFDALINCKAGYVRIDGESISYGATQYPGNLCQPYMWGMLEDLFFTERYKLKWIRLTIGIGNVTISGDSVAFGCKKVTFDEINRIVAAIAEYRK